MFFMRIRSIKETKNSLDVAKNKKVKFHFEKNGINIVRLIVNLLSQLLFYFRFFFHFFFHFFFFGVSRKSERQHQIKRSN